MKAREIIDLIPRLKGRVWWIAALVVIFAELFVRFWMLPDTKRWAEVPLLTLVLAPEEERTPDGRYRHVDQPERLGGAVEQLSFSRGQCGAFYPLVEEIGSAKALDFFYFEYEPGNPRFIHDVFGHAPEVCMRAIGAVLQREHETREIVVSGKPVPVRVLEFASPVASGPLWVFQMIWLPPEAPFQPDDKASTLRREKLLSGLLGNPNPPARVLLAGSRGFESLDSAWEEYERLLVSRLVVR